MAAAVAFLLIASVALLSKFAGAVYVLEVGLRSYTNLEHRDSNGECCDGYENNYGRCWNHCDNIFTFCLRGSGRYGGARDLYCPLGKYAFHYHYDKITGIRIFFYGINPWPGSAELYVRVTDHDFWSSNDHVDDIYVMINLRPGEATSRQTVRGVYKRSTLELSFRLWCWKHFYGEDCSTFCHPVDSDEGHYVCGANGERLCLGGWKDPGNNCLTPVCEGCNPIGGECTAPYICTCAYGWEGTDCKQCTQTSPGCSPTGGFCTRPGECRCHDGYAGDNCEVYLLPCTNNEICQNGGTCINDHRGSYVCQCVDGYEGRNCTQSCDPCTYGNCVDEGTDVYNDTACLNGGTCVQEDGSNVSHCICSHGFTGLYCEDVNDSCIPNPCMNHGSCQRDQGQSTGYVCSCLAGYTGSRCEADINYCQDQPCRNNGSCIETTGGYECICPSGWVGKDCGEERNECEEFQPCRNGATCVDQFDDYKCECALGFYGMDCEYEMDACLSQPCQNGNCTTTEDGYRCSCYEEYSGANCEIDLNSCRSDPCLHGGTCESTTDGYFICNCPPGYTSFNCEDSNVCLSAPCEHGTCLVTGGDYLCMCDPGFTGRNCSTSSLASTQQGVVDIGAVVGGVFGGLSFLLLVVAMVLLVIGLFHRRKPHKYTVMSSLDAGFPSQQGEGYDNPTYVSDYNTNALSDERIQSDHTYSSIGSSFVILRAAGEDESLDIEYHNFDNPLYSDGREATSNETPPSYDRTSQPGRRRGNTRLSGVTAESDATPYDYISVTQLQREGAAANGRKEHSAIAGTDSPGQQSQDKDIYESVNS